MVGGHAVYKVSYIIISFLTRHETGDIIVVWNRARFIFRFLKNMVYAMKIMFTLYLGNNPRQ